MLFACRILPVTFLAPVILLLAGCSGSSDYVPSNLAPVSGTLKVDGDPAAAVAIVFIPTDETKGTGGFAVTDEQGRYTLQHRSGNPGIEPGTYRVILSKMAMPDGSPVPPNESAADVGAEESIPPSYSSPERTILNATVPAEGSKELDFKVSFK